ncbi:hypothetical protein D3C72_2039140 [compost metagenome]
MGDNDGHTATLTNAENGRRQRILTFGIEIGIRLIEHDEKGVSIKRPRKGDPLFLPRR